MTWTCPQCGRNFKNHNQWHSCEKRDLDHHFATRSPGVKLMVAKLIEAANDFGVVELDTVKTSIQLKAGPTFLSIRPKKNHLEIDFSLGRRVDSFPIYKSTRISGKRVLHQATVEHADDIDGSLVALLHEAYELVSEND